MYTDAQRSLTYKTELSNALFPCLLENMNFSGNAARWGRELHFLDAFFSKQAEAKLS